MFNIVFFFFTGKYEVVDTDVRESLKEALSVCEESLKNIKRQRIWYLLISLFLAIPLIWSMGLESTISSIGIGTSIALNIGRLLFTATLWYTLFMSSIWNCVEKNALKAGYLAMEIRLMQLNNHIIKH